MRVAVRVAVCVAVYVAAQVAVMSPPPLIVTAPPARRSAPRAQAVSDSHTSLAPHASAHPPTDSGVDSVYEVATISRLLEITGLFRRIQALL